MKPQGQSAFTLVELLVVIGIIALLISILLPAISSARRVANQTKCLAIVRELGHGMQLYVNDFDSWVLPNWEMRDQSPDTPTFVRQGWYWYSNTAYRQTLGYETYRPPSANQATQGWPEKLFCPDAGFKPGVSVLGEIISPAMFYWPNDTNIRAVTVSEYLSGPHYAG